MTTYLSPSSLKASGFSLCLPVLAPSVVRIRSSLPANGPEVALPPWALRSAMTPLLKSSYVLITAPTCNGSGNIPLAAGGDHDPCRGNRHSHPAHRRPRLAQH